MVSHFATDGFALLRADAINKTPSKSSKRTSDADSSTSTVNTYNIQRPPPDSAVEAAGDTEAETAQERVAQDDQTPPMKSIGEEEGQFIPELLSRAEEIEDREGANGGKRKRKGGKRSGGKGRVKGKGRGKRAREAQDDAEVEQ